MHEFIDVPVIMIKVKAMLEFGFITEENMKIKATRFAWEAGIDWVKQFSGWGKGGCAATVDDVRLLKANIQAPCRVKVSGRVNTLAKMKEMFAAGTERVGTSSGPALVTGLVGDINAYWPAGVDCRAEKCAIKRAGTSRRVAGTANQSGSGAAHQQNRENYPR